MNRNGKIASSVIVIIILILSFLGLYRPRDDLEWAIEGGLVGIPGSYSGGTSSVSGMSVTESSTDNWIYGDRYSTRLCENIDSGGDWGGLLLNYYLNISSSGSADELTIKTAILRTSGGLDTSKKESRSVNFVENTETRLVTNLITGHVTAYDNVNNIRGDLEMKYVFYPDRIVMYLSFTPEADGTDVQYLNFEANGDLDDLNHTVEFYNQTLDGTDSLAESDGSTIESDTEDGPFQTCWYYFGDSQIIVTGNKTSDWYGTNELEYQFTYKSASNYNYRRMERQSALTESNKYENIILISFHDESASGISDLMKNVRDDFWNPMPEGASGIDSISGSTDTWTYDFDEGCYVTSDNDATDDITFNVTTGSYNRYNPVFKVTSWGVSNYETIQVYGNDTLLTEGTDYYLDVDTYTNTAVMWLNNTLSSGTETEFRIKTSASFSASSSPTGYSSSDWQEYLERCLETLCENTDSNGDIVINGDSPPESIAPRASLGAILYINATGNEILPGTSYNVSEYATNWTDAVMDGVYAYTSELGTVAQALIYSGYSSGNYWNYLSSARQDVWADDLRNDSWPGGSINPNIHIKGAARGPVCEKMGWGERTGWEDELDYGYDYYRGAGLVAEYSGEISLYSTIQARSYATINEANSTYRYSHMCQSWEEQLYFSIYAFDPWTGFLPIPGRGIGTQWMIETAANIAICANRTNTNRTDVERGQARRIVNLIFQNWAQQFDTTTNQTRYMTNDGIDTWNEANCVTQAPQVLGWLLLYGSYLDSYNEVELPSEQESYVKEIGLTLSTDGWINCYNAGKSVFIHIPDTDRDERGRPSDLFRPTGYAFRSDVIANFGSGNKKLVNVLTDDTIVNTSVNVGGGYKKYSTEESGFYMHYYYVAVENYLVSVIKAQIDGSKTVSRINLWYTMVDNKTNLYTDGDSNFTWMFYNGTNSGWDYDYYFEWLYNNGSSKDADIIKSQDHAADARYINGTSSFGAGSDYRLDSGSYTDEVIISEQVAAAFADSKDLTDIQNKVTRTSLGNTETRFLVQGTEGNYTLEIDYSKTTDWLNLTFEAAAADDYTFTPSINPGGYASIYWEIDEGDLPVSNVTPDGQTAGTAMIAIDWTDMPADAELEMKWSNCPAGTTLYADDDSGFGSPIAWDSGNYTTYGEVISSAAVSDPDYIWLKLDSTTVAPFDFTITFNSRAAN